MGICMLQTANRNRNSTNPLDTKPFKTKPNTKHKPKFKTKANTTRKRQNSYSTFYF